MRCQAVSGTSWLLVLRSLSLGSGSPAIACSYCTLLCKNLKSLFSTSWFTEKYALLHIFIFFKSQHNGSLLSVFLPEARAGNISVERDWVRSVRKIPADSKPNYGIQNLDSCLQKINGNKLELVGPMPDSYLKEIGQNMHSKALVRKQLAS
ncbi:predicted protein [Nematostella vectensis]|uniref:Uncharacterized protein n=1 Tax=Nematostella vectensis TaxID=45351 RepID=A7SPI0_NEMVE|nr:predicted protein [Nematostella vectensis]|eukprot:XP_001626494.1 predicted protein [Nematostella vectensis]